MPRSNRAALGGLAAACALSCAGHGTLAADLPRRRAPAPVAAVPPAFTWTGLYLGLNAGYGFRDRSGRFTDPTFGGTASRSGGGDGFAGGGQVGYELQLTPGAGLVLGVETDIQGMASARADAAYLGTAPYDSVAPRVDHFGTVRGRAGYAFDRVLIYGTGGFAYAGGSIPSGAGAYPYTLPSATRTGYAFGGGLEYAFTRQLSARIEALRIELGKRYANPTAYDGTGRGDPSFTVVRAGVNYRF